MVGHCVSGKATPTRLVARFREVNTGEVKKDAPIILLVEATASIDSVNECCIQSAINHLVRDNTMVIIVHRLHTLQTGDRIVIIDKGRILEAGKHDDLLQAGGLYRKLRDEQQRTKAWKW
jgi:ATP-binding cassette subfamily B protein